MRPRGGRWESSLQWLLKSLSFSLDSACHLPRQTASAPRGNEGFLLGAWTFPLLRVTYYAPSVCHKQPAVRARTFVPRHSEDPVDWSIVRTACAPSLEPEPDPEDAPRARVACTPGLRFSGAEQRLVGTCAPQACAQVLRCRM